MQRRLSNYAVDRVAGHLLAGAGVALGRRDYSSAVGTGRGNAVIA